MENSSQPITSNPQQAAPPQDATTSSGFQETVTSEDLNSQTGNISVQQTGEPVSDLEVSSVKESSMYIWGFVVVFIFIVGIFLLIKFIKNYSPEEDEYEEEEASSEPEAVPKKVTIDKKSNKKKSAPNQRRKKAKKAKR